MKILKMVSCLMCLPIAGIAAEEVVMEDTFTVNISSAQPMPLNGRRLEKGKTSWVSRGTMAQVTPKGVVMTPSGNASAAATLPSGVKSMRFEAEVNPAGQEYIGIALGGDDLEPTWWDKEVGSQVMVLIRPTGYMGSYAKGSSISILPESTGVPRFNPEKPVKIELIYDATANTVTIRANGVTMLSKYNLTENVDGFTPIITTVGVYFLQPRAGEPGGTVDNIKVTKL